MYALVLIIHVIVAIFLIAVILLQTGRGGLGEAMGGAAAQSLFGGGVNTVMSRITAVSAALFMITCLSLAALSTGRGRSVIDQLPVNEEQLPLALPTAPVESAASSAPAPSQPSTAPHPDTTPSRSAPTPAGASQPPATQ